MPEVVVRIGGVARLQPDPERQLGVLEWLAQPDEVAEWVKDYERGDWVFVQLGLFAEALGATGVTRYDGPSVDALSFAVPHGPDNIDHAEEMVLNGIDGLAAALVAAGMDVDAETLARLPVAVELADDLRRVLHAAP